MKTICKLENYSENDWGFTCWKMDPIHLNGIFLVRNLYWIWVWVLRTIKGFSYCFKTLLKNNSIDLIFFSQSEIIFLLSSLSNSFSKFFVLFEPKYFIKNCQINYAFDKFKIKKLMPETEGKTPRNILQTSPWTCCNKSCVAKFVQDFASFYVFLFNRRSKKNINKRYFYVFSKFFCIKIKLLFCF
jgi:hypothetical protein